MREALVIQAGAINLLMSAVSSLMHGDPQDEVVLAKIEDAANSFRKFSDSLREMCVVVAPPTGAPS